MEARDAVVVGGGPAGAATALFLRQQGLDVLLLDEAAFPRDKICGESVSPEAWRILRSLGVAEAVARRDPRLVHGMRLTSPDGTSFSGRYRGTSDAGFALRRSVLDELLLCCVRTAGVEVRERTRVLDLLFENDRVCGVRCGSPQEPHAISARLVVGADGRRSVVARRLGLLTEHPSLRKFAVRGHWDGMQGLDEYGEMHVLDGGYCGVAPLGDGVANVAFVLDRREMREAGGDLEGFYRRTLRRWPRLAERLAQARLLAPPRAIGPLALSARRVSTPGALLVGDSAGFYDPFTGEGVTLALRSAELAAEVAIPALAAGGPCTDLRAYDRSRHAVTKDKFLLNRLLQRIIAWPALSNAVARRLARRPDLADRLVGIAGDFVPARSALGPAFLWELLRG